MALASWHYIVAVVSSLERVKATIFLMYSLDERVSFLYVFTNFQNFKMVPMRFAEFYFE